MARSVVAPRRFFRTAAVILFGAFAISSCRPEAAVPPRGGWMTGPPPPGPTGPPPATRPPAPPRAPGPTVAEVEASGCSTSVVDGLSRQIMHEASCMRPSMMVQVRPHPNLELGPAAYPYLVAPARDALEDALRARPDLTLRVSSMFRTVAQQYLLRRWADLGRCGIALAAKPGRSNHETGLAFDAKNADMWRSTLEPRGFAWFGLADPVHFDFAPKGGAGELDQRGLDVEAFQRLWNRNFPSDAIVADGQYGEATAERLARAPASGFLRGAACVLR